MFQVYQPTLELPEPAPEWIEELLAEQPELDVAPAEDAAA
jgi:hypothetical protein